MNIFDKEVVSLPKKEESESISNIKKGNTYIPYYSKEFRDIVKFIQDELKKNVYLIGIRAMYERGIPAYRLTEDFDIFTPLTKKERNDIISYVRGKYKKSKEIWRKFGFGIDFYPVGKLHHVDVNIISPLIYDESWDELMIEINGVRVFLPPLEDLIILKLLSPRKKDQKDIGFAFRIGKDKIDWEKLLSKAERIGIENKLIRLEKKYEVDLE